MNTENYKAIDSDETIFVDGSNTKGPWDGTKNNPFQSIQEGINAVDDNIKTVYVAPGTYNEDIFIDKTINLIGTHKSNTIINGTGKGSTVRITKDNVYLTGFNIKNSGRGSSDAGISISSRYVNISNNNITSNYYGLYVSSMENIIYENVILSNWKGIRVFTKNNIITRNLIKNNDVGMYFCCSATENIVYYNNFIGNSQKQGEDNQHGSYWDNGNIGNYWDDYTGEDIDGDGIGNTAYIVDKNRGALDNYPLINPFKIESWFESYTKDKKDDLSTPGFELIILITILSLFVFIKKIKNKF